MKKKRKPRPKCKQSGKAIFPTEKSALRGMMVIHSRDPSAFFGSLHVYPCPACKKYHIGGTKEKYKTLRIN